MFSSKLHFIKRRKDNLNEVFYNKIHENKMVMPGHLDVYHKVHTGSKMKPIYLFICCVSPSDQSITRFIHQNPYKSFVRLIYSSQNQPTLQFMTSASLFSIVSFSRSRELHQFNTNASGSSSPRPNNSVSIVFECVSFILLTW